MHRILLPLFIFLSSVVSSQDSVICYLHDHDGRIREHNVDFIKMLLNVKFNTNEGKVMGNVKYDFKPIQYITDTLFLNAPYIAIKNVTLDGQPVTYKTDSMGVTIRFSKTLDWNKTYKMEIIYEATPRKGLYFIGWDVNEPNITGNKYYTRKQIWTQGQGIDNRHWIPCYDDVNDKMLIETIITFDSTYTVVSNGKLKSKKANADGTATWNYSMNKPMVPYLIMIGIDKYKYKDYKSKNGVVSRQYYYADKPETVEATYQYSAEMMDWLPEELMVKYPWETYANIPVQDFMYGAMENTTATVFTDYYVMDWRGQLERNYVATNAHELTHQWFGDLITEYSATHHWLHESFATYYAKHFTRKIYGEDHYEWGKRGEGWSAINADKNDRFPVADSRGGSARHYPKGSYVIDMLRYVVGDSVYRKVISKYLQKHAYANVTNEDFKMAFMEFAGVNLDWFFNQWIYRSGIPDYEIRTQRNEYEVAFYVTQKQKTDHLQSYFKMPFVFEVYYEDGTSTIKRVWLSREQDTVYLPLMYGKKYAFALFDPGAAVLKTVAYEKPLIELQAQALNARHFVDRYEALIALQKYTADEKRDFLIQLFARNNYYPIQEEILRQLAKDNHASTISLQQQAMQSKDYMVRRAAIDQPENIHASVLPFAEKLLSDSSYQTIENTLRKLSRLFPEKKQSYLQQVKDVYGINNNVRIAYLELSSDPANPAKTLSDELIGYTSNHYEFRTRGKAMEAVERLGISSPDLLKNLMNAMLYNNGRLSGPATRVFKSLIKNPDNRQTASGLIALGNWKPWQKEILDKVMQ